MNEAATMVGTITAKAPASGATMDPIEGERILFVPKTTLIAGVLAVTMMSPPVFAPAATLTSAEGGETANLDLALADGMLVDQDDLVDLDALSFEAEVMPLAPGLRLAEVAYRYPPPDPDLLVPEE